MHVNDSYEWFTVDPVLVRAQAFLLRCVMSRTMYRQFLCSVAPVSCFYSLVTCFVLQINILWIFMSLCLHQINFWLRILWGTHKVNLRRLSWIIIWIFCTGNLYTFAFCAILRVSFLNENSKVWIADMYGASVWIHLQLNWKATL